MSSTQEGSSAATSTGKKGGWNRRSWTQKEEATLITALKELVVTKFTTENGFKAGYLKKLEDAMQETFPGTDLKASPHIISKLSTWKKYYYSLNAMMSRSGVGFNSRENFMIDCEDDQWEQIVKMDPNARLMRHKQWPYYEDWVEIFGTDRATGEQAEDIFEAFTDIQNNQHGTSEVGQDGEKEMSYENEVDDGSNDQVSQSARVDCPTKKSSKSKKKARFNDDLQGVCELLADMNEATNKRLDNLASRLGYDMDSGKARQETWEHLSKIPGLNIADRVAVCELVTFKLERLDMWRAMDQEARAQYVDHLLKITRS